MPDFKDTRGRTWTVSVNCTSIERAKSGCSVDLLQIVEAGGELLRKLENPILLVSTLYHLVKPQADKQSPPVTAEDFGEAMAGDAIDAGAAALLEDVANFFPKDRRPALKALMHKANQAKDAMGKRALSTVEAIDVEKLINEVLGQEQPPTSAEIVGATPPSPEYAPEN
jgi:hypothetical protein